MQTKTVEVVPWDAAWPEAFQKIADALAAALGPCAEAIQHVGSTSVPGLWAKPVIRAHPEAAKEYGRVKRDGAALYPHDADAYILYKEPFILSVYRLCGL